VPHGKSTVSSLLTVSNTRTKTQREQLTSTELSKWDLKFCVRGTYREETVIIDSPCSPATLELSSCQQDKNGTASPASIFDIPLPLYYSTWSFCTEAIPIEENPSTGYTKAYNGSRAYSKVRRIKSLKLRLNCRTHGEQITKMFTRQPRLYPSVVRALPSEGKGGQSLRTALSTITSSEEAASPT